MLCSSFFVNAPLISLIHFFGFYFSETVPELQGEPEEISKEKARLAAKEVPQKYALNVFVEFAYERMMNI